LSQLNQIGFCRQILVTPISYFMENRPGCMPYYIYHE
jgi:hypothetical protein